MNMAIQTDLARPARPHRADAVSEPALADLVFELFSGRRDAYAIQTEKGFRSVKRPLSLEEVAGHLQGKHRLAVYPLKEDGTASMGCVDLDLVRGREQDIELLHPIVEAVVARAVDEGLFPYLEVSKSRGLHLWFFSTEAIPSLEMRAALALLIKNVSVQPGISIEIFPKSENGLGSPICLPLHGTSLKNSKTVFVDFGLEPYSDQVDFLKNIKRTPTEAIRRLARTAAVASKVEDSRPDANEPPNRMVDLEGYLRFYGVGFRKKVEPHRFVFQLFRCPFSDAHTTGDGLGHSAIIQNRTSGKVTFNCKHAHCADKTWQEARLAISGRDSLLRFISTDKEVDMTDHKACEVIDLRHFLTMPIAQPEPLIAGGILPPRALLVIGGLSKVGKSILFLNMAISLSTGRPFLGRFEIPRPRRGIIWQGEISEISLQERLRIMMRGVEKPPGPGLLQINNQRDLRIDRDVDFDSIRKVIEKEKPDFVAFDPLSKYHSKEENRSDAMREVIGRFDRLIQEYGVSILLVHHFGKGNAEIQREGAVQLRGSSVLFDAGDTYLSIQRKSVHEDKKFVKLTVELRNAEDPPPFILCRNCHLWFEICSEGTDRLLSVQDVIETLQGMGGEALRAELIERVSTNFGVSESTSRRAVDQASPQFLLTRLPGRGGPLKVKLRTSLFSSSSKSLTENET